MRRAHRVKSTAHLVLAVATLFCTSWQLDAHPESYAWLLPMALAFLAIVLEIPEIARVDAPDPVEAELATLHREFEAHCRAGGWNDVDLALSPKGHYVFAPVNEGWKRWQANAEAGRGSLKG
jgi:hypothetical protein